MQSTLAANETDPHDIFVIEPDVVLAARVGHAAADPARGSVHAGSAPPINTAPDISVVSTVAAIESTLRAAAANDDIHVPRDIHPTTDRSFWGPWAKRASVGFVFALCSAVAAESWNHYGDSARAVIANWTPAFAMTSSQSSATADATQAATPVAQAAAADPAQTPVQSAPDAASVAAAPAAAASPDAPALAAMSEEIAQLKATVEQLKAGQEQMAQQIARDAVKPVAAKPAVVRTSAKPQPSTAQAKAADANWRAKVTAALPPRPAPPRNPRPAYAPAPTAYYPPQATYGSPAQPTQAPYDSRAQVTDPIDGAPVVRPPMPLQ